MPFIRKGGVVVFFNAGVRSVTVAATPDDTYFLDVREDDEWAAGHIAGAHHVPLSGFLPRIGELPTDREIVCVCRVGARSAQVAAFLSDQGYQAVNLDGGMEAWDAAGRSMVSDSGTPPVVI